MFWKMVKFITRNRSIASIPFRRGDAEGCKRVAEVSVVVTFFLIVKTSRESK